MQIMTFWNVMPCSFVDTCQSLMGTSCPHLWDKKISCVRKGNPHTGNWRQELEFLAGQCETVAVRDEKNFKEGREKVKAWTAQGPRSGGEVPCRVFTS